MPSQPPITSVTDPRWLRAVSHPIRIRLLAMLQEEPASPVILAAKLGQPLGTVAYHVRTLYDLGLLKLVSTRQRRGATEHYYKAVESPTMSDDAWADLDPVSKQRLLTALLTRSHDYETRAAAAGGFDRPDSSFNSATLELDDQGWQELTAAARELLSRVQTITAEAAERLKAAPESKLDVGLTVHVYEALPFSAEQPTRS